MPEFTLVRGVYVARFTEDEIGRGDCDDMQVCLSEILKGIPPGVRILLLDMRGVNFMRSSGLGAMLSLCEKLKPLGVKVAVASVPTFGRNLFKISKLDEHLTIFPTLDEGLDALGWGDAEGPDAESP